MLDPPRWRRLPHPRSRRAGRRPPGPARTMRLAGTASLVIPFTHALPDLLALGADRKLLGVPAGDPHLATERHHRRPVDHGVHQLVLGDVVGEALVVTVVGGLGAFVELRVLQDTGPEPRCLLAVHRSILTPGRIVPAGHDETPGRGEGGDAEGGPHAQGAWGSSVWGQAARAALIRSTNDSVGVSSCFAAPPVGVSASAGVSVATGGAIGARPSRASASTCRPAST